MKWLRLVRLFRIRASLTAAWRMMRNPLVPLHLKLVALGLALLILSPLNILGDLPLLGLVDDVALLSLLAGWFVRAAVRYEQSVPLDAAEMSLLVR